MHHAAVDIKTPGNRIKREALAEHIAKIQCHPPRQCLQADNAQQPADAGLDLGKLATFRLQLETAAQACQIRCIRATNPGQLTGYFCPTTAHGIGQAKTAEKLADIITFQAHIHF